MPLHISSNALTVQLFMQIYKAQEIKKKGGSSSDGNEDDEDVADYGKAGAIAEEVLSAINIVTSFGGQTELVEWYVYTYSTIYICSM